MKKKLALAASGAAREEQDERGLADDAYSLLQHEYVKVEFVKTFTLRAQWKEDQPRRAIVWQVIWPDDAAGIKVLSFYRVYRRYNRKTSYYHDWCTASGRAPARRDRLSTRVFRDKVLVAQLARVERDAAGHPLPTALHYSKVARLCTEEELFEHLTQSLKKKGRGDYRGERIKVLKKLRNRERKLLTHHPLGDSTKSLDKPVKTSGCGPDSLSFLSKPRTLTVDRVLELFNEHAPDLLTDKHLFPEKRALIEEYLENTNTSETELVKLFQRANKQYLPRAAKWDVYQVLQYQAGVNADKYAKPFTAPGQERKKRNFKDWLPEL